MNYFTVVLFSFSVFIATGLAWLRFKKIQAGFIPFIICLSVASLNEITSFLLARFRINNAYNNNLYVLMEAMLITWQFKQWGLFKHNKLFIALMLLMPVCWFIENFLVFNFSQISLYFRIGYSYLVVMMSINRVSALIITVRNNLIASPEFLICLGFIIYFTNKILFEAFWLYGVNVSAFFIEPVFVWLTWTNLFVNLIYAVAVLCIPKKPQFIMPFA